MSRTPLRLTLAAPPLPSREQLRTVLPRQLWPALQPPGSGVESSGPLLLSFLGTNFMDDCFAWLAGGGGLPPQRAWRDWCEPPLAMLARSGTAAYPATVQRGRPWGLRAESDPGPASALASDGVPKGTPPWLRKLYLPQHDRFTVVVLELICQAAGWPPLDRQRVKEAGLLVRRLRRSDPAGAEVWEDWIASDPRLGRWEVPPPEWEESGRDPAARPGLASQPLALAPVTLAGVGKRCLLHGYLSLTSAEQEVPAAPSLGGTRAAASNALQQRANAQLQALGAGDAATTWLPPKALLLSLLRDTVLPPATTSTSPGSANDADLNNVLKQLIKAALDSNLFTNDTNGNVVSGQTLWNQAVAAVHSSPGINVPIAPIQARLEQLLELWFTGQALPSDLTLPELWDPLLPALIAAALVRARGCRLALAAAMNASQSITDVLTIADTVSPRRALHSLADLGEGLESFLATEAERQAGRALAPWGQYTAPGDAPRLLRVDRTLRALADHYAPLEASLAEAGAQVGLELRERADTLETELTPASPTLLELGLDLLEPPAVGLLVLPGLGDGAAQRFADFRQKVLSRYNTATAGPQVEAEALVASQLRRPRFDAHHIYAVEAWVRVAPRRPGEEERVIWSPRSEPFVLAEPGDLLGSQPQTVPLPDVGRLLRDLGRLRKAGANPFLTLVPPPRSGGESRGGLDGLRRDWGLGTPVALVAPVLAVVGLGMLSGALRTVSRLPGFAWMRQVVVRSPAPERRP